MSDEVLSVNSEQNKRYIGDGVYVAWDGYYIKLTTEDGISETNIIVLENEVLNEFLRFVKQVEYTCKAYKEMKHDTDRSDGDSKGT